MAWLKKFAVWGEKKWIDLFGVQAAGFRLMTGVLLQTEGGADEPQSVLVENPRGWICIRCSPTHMHFECCQLHHTDLCQ